MAHQSGPYARAMEPGRDHVSIETYGSPVRVDFAVVDGAAEVIALAEVAQAREGSALVAVLSADLGDLVAGVLETLRPSLREIVCCDGPADDSGRAALGFDLAGRALDDLGVGQDFVYTVPAVEDAVDHAVRTIATGDSGWSGQAILVVGGRVIVARARRHLSSPG